GRICRLSPGGTVRRRTGTNACPTGAQDEENSHAAAVHRPVLLHAAEPRRGRHHGEALPPEQDRGRTVFEPRPGSGFRRHGVRARKAGLAGADDSQHRGPARQRCAAARRVHAAHGEIRFADEREGRHEPLRRPGKPAHCFAYFDAGGPDPGDDGRGHRRALPGAENRRHDLDRRRRQLDRRVSRRIEFRGDAEGALRAGPRKQPLGVFDSGAASGAAREPRGPRQGLRYPELHCRWERRGRSVFDRERSGRTRARGRRPNPHRSQDVSPARARAARSRRVRAQGEARVPILLYEKFLAKGKILDEKGRKEIEEKIDSLLVREREFAENSPMPPPEFAATGVYCTGDDCHKIRPKWERPIAEVTPPKSSVAAVWTVPGFGAGKSTSGKASPIHFGDTQPHRAAAGPERNDAPNGKSSAKKMAKAVVAAA